MLLFTSCQKEEPDQNALQSEESVDIEVMIQKDKEAYADYVAKNGEVTIEYMTLEELQDFVAVNDLPKISEETIEKYNTSKRLKTSGACSSGWINYCGDHNQNGTFSSSDLVYFNGACDPVCPGKACTDHVGPCVETWNLPGMFRRFGYLSYYRNPGSGTEDPNAETYYYNVNDYNAAYDFILGVATC